MPDFSGAGIVIVLLIAFLIYRRSRSLFVRQKYSRTRLIIRLVLIGLFGAFLSPAMVVAQGLLPVVIGILVGLALGIASAFLSRFDWQDSKLYFKPNGWIGLGLLTLLLGRIAFRLIKLRDFDGQLGSPLTAALLFVLLAYYLGFAGSLILRGESLPAPAPGSSITTNPEPEPPSVNP